MKPPFAKFADALGRLEAYALAILIFIIGYIQMAASKNVKTFASAQIFYSAGSTGIQIVQQVFIADTSDLTNRALFSTLPDIPFLVTVWIGPVIAGKLTTNWRWGYAIWTFILPICFIPLALSMMINERKAEKKGLLPPRVEGPLTIFRAGSIIKKFFIEIDTLGMLLLSAGFGMLLIPLTLASKQSSGWKTPWIIALLILGPLFLIAFPFWEARKRQVPFPLIRLGMLRTRTFCCGCALGFFYFAAFYMSVYPYFTSYLLVVKNQSAQAAGHITQTFSFTSTVSSVAVSLLIKYSGRYQIWLISGTLIYIMGLGLMMKYRTDGTSIGSIIGSQICLGIGGGMTNVAAQLGVQASVTHQEVAAATAVFLLVLEIGGAVGAAISGAIWTKMVPERLALYLPEGSKDQAAAIFSSITVAADSFPSGTLERDAVNRAYQDTMRVLLIGAICIAVPIFPLALAVKNYHLDKIDQVRGRVVGGFLSGVGGKVREGKGWAYEILGVGKEKKEEEVKAEEEAKDGEVVVGERLVEPASPVEPEEDEIRRVPTRQINGAENQ